MSRQLAKSKLVDAAETTSRIAATVTVLKREVGTRCVNAGDIRKKKLSNNHILKKWSTGR